MSQTGPIGTATQCEDSVVEVTLHDLERGTLTRYLAPGDAIDAPADRVEVHALDKEVVDERT